EFPRSAAGTYFMFGGLASVVGMVQRITGSTDAMLSQMRRRSWRAPYRPRRGPGLIRGRGLARRRALPLLPAGTLAWLIATVLALGILTLYVLYGV
ncbi:MAG TPA: hypothetical protein VFY93_06090, partial [Planctomycetota bacterium]|nr:hypothetical protein [Planctomycetota bacterium]